MNQLTLPLLATAILTSTVLFAQDDEKEHHHHNYFRAGYQMTDLVGDVAYDIRPGFYAGYNHTIVKAPLIGVSVGAEYNTGGARLDDFDIEIATSYVGVPANARLKLGPVYVDAGFDAAFLIGDKLTVDGNEVEGDNDLETFDLLGHAGVGVKFLFLGLEARYRYGFTEVTEGYRNTGIQIGAVLFLP